MAKGRKPLFLIENIQQDNPHTQMALFCLQINLRRYEFNARRYREVLATKLNGLAGS